MKKTQYRVTFINPADTSDEYHFYTENKQRALEHAQQFVGKQGEVTVTLIKERDIFQTSELFTYEQFDNKQSILH